MQDIIKLKLVDLGYNKEDYNLDGLMDWLDEKNNIIFITNLSLIKSDIFTYSKYNFLIPCIDNYEDYLKIKGKYGGLPIALEEYQIKYLEWLKSIDFFNFINRSDIKLDIKQGTWCIYSYNYKSVKRINSKLKEKLIKKSIKIKKLKI